MGWGILCTYPKITQSVQTCLPLTLCQTLLLGWWQKGALKVPRAGPDGQFVWGTCYVLITSRVGSLAHTLLTTSGHKGREGFPFFVLQTETGKQMPFLLPQHPYQGPLQSRLCYRWLQESLVLLLMATIPHLPSTRHGCLHTNPWKQKPQTNYSAARAGTMHKPLQVLESSDEIKNSSPFPQVVKEFWAGAQNTRLLLYSSLKWHFLFPYSSPAAFMGRSSSTFPL